MTKKNNIGTISLSISFIGTILLLLGIHHQYLTHYGWNYLLAGFEAAVIGGFADWFAVRALFREIPIPFIKKHTNIIVKSRTKLQDGIVDLVSNQWLSKDSISSKIKEVNFVEKLLSYANKPKNEVKIVHFIQKSITEFLDKTDLTQFEPTLNKTLKAELVKANIGKPLGSWLQETIEKKQHHIVWDMALETVSKTVNSSDTKAILKQHIKKQTTSLKKESDFKEILVTGAQIFGGFDSESLLKKLISAINLFITEAQNNPNHPVRKKVNQQLIDFSKKLVNNDASATKHIQDLQENISNNVESSNLITQLLKGLQENLKKDVTNDNSDLLNFIKSHYQSVLWSLEENEDFILETNATISKTIANIIEGNHDVIAQTISENLDKLEDKELVNQIEDKVGNDLQYIRLNGAIVGGIVGMILYGLKTFLV